AEGRRAGCPDCGKQVAVNRDGSLRKHSCAPGAVSMGEPEPVEVEAAPVRTTVSAAEDVELRTTVAPVAPSHASPRRPRYCRVSNCGRPPREGSPLCATHRLHTHLVW